MDIDLNRQPYNKNSRKNSIILQISALIATLSIIVFGLNYFKIIDLKRSSQKSIATPTPGTIDPKLRKTLPFMSCPIQNCNRGIVVRNASSSAYSISFDNLPTGSTISAVLSGKFTRVNSSTFTIENTQRGILATYSIKTNAIKMQVNLSDVTENQPIGTLGSGPNSLILSAIATITNQSLHLESGKDGKYLTSQD